MDAGGRKKEPPLPPGYVSLEMLRQRWLRMQEAKNLKGEREEVKRGSPSNEDYQVEPTVQNEGDQKRGGGLLRDPLRSGVEDREGLVEGKEVAMVGFDRGDARKQKKKNGKRKKKKKKIEKKDSENGDKIGDVEIVGDDLKGVQGTETASRYGVGEQVWRPNRRGFRRNGGDRGFRRNGGDKLGHRGGKGYRFEPDDGMKEGGVKLDLGKNQKESEGGRIITKRDGDGVGASKEEVLEVANRIRDLNTGFRGEKDDRGEIGGRRHRSGSFRPGFQGFSRAHSRMGWNTGFGNRAHSRMEWNTGSGSRAHSRRERNTGYARGYGNSQDMHGKAWVKKGEKPSDAAVENAI